MTIKLVCIDNMFLTYFNKRTERLVFVYLPWEILFDFLLLPGVFLFNVLKVLINLFSWKVYFKVLGKHLIDNVLIPSIAKINKFLHYLRIRVNTSTSLTENYRVYCVNRTGLYSSNMHFYAVLYTFCLKHRPCFHCTSAKLNKGFVCRKLW